MAEILDFSHARTSSRSALSILRAASAVRASASSFSVAAVSVARMADHHSAGTLLRCHHFETAEAPAPISAAMASREGHFSIKARKDAKSVIPDLIGQSVLKRKADLSLDGKILLGHTVQMADSVLKTQYDQELIARVKAARIATGKKQWQVAELLGIKQDQYKHYEVGRPIPHHLIGRFCLICSIDPNWLLTGKGAKPLQATHIVAEEPAPVRKPKRAKRSRAA